MVIPKPIPDLTEEQKAYVWGKIHRGGPDECWIATAKPSGRYVLIRLNGKSYLLHRVVLTISVGPFPLDKPFACHTCDVTFCSNPHHLYWGTQQDNIQDGWKRGRIKPLVGEANHGRRKLTELAVIAIRNDRAAGLKLQDIASKYGICERQAWVIVNRRQWTHI